MLPLPCTVPSPVGRRRNILVVLCLVSVVALYHYSAPISQANNTAVTWRPDLAGLINPGNIGSVWHHTQPKDASYYDLRAANPNNFRIKSPAASLLPQQHFTKNPPSSQGNPWPSKPEILERYFNPQRKIQDPPLPDWPTASNLRQADELLNRPAIHFVPFDELYMGKNKIPDMGKPKRNPKRVQSTDTAESEEERAERHRRRDWVEKAIRHAWEGYKEFAWGADEVRPLTNGSNNPFNGWGATLVDSLDLLLMLGWERDYAVARTHVRALDFTMISGGRSAYGMSDGASIPTFETCIRYLGGFLAAYDLSGDELMLKRGRELGDWLLGAFGTSSGLPLGRYKLGYNPEGKPAGRQVLAEAGSMLLEMTRLSKLTGDDRYFKAVQRTTDFFDNAFDDVRHPKGLFPLHITDVNVASLVGTYSFGGQADSYYEYLIKEHHLLGGSTKQYGKMYSEALDTAKHYLMSDVIVVPGVSLFTIGENHWDSYTPKLDHLTCFAGAMMALGSKLLNRPQDLVNADAFTESCVWSYNMTQSGVGPESITFFSPNDESLFSKYEDEDGSYLVQRGNPVAGMRKTGKSYKGRPETIESVFYMWRITRDKKWQDKGWQMFHALVEATAVPAGFAQIKDVFSEPLKLKDSCESFLLAETMKYYWLLFSDADVVSLDDHVFTTEAHPLKTPNAPKQHLRDYVPRRDIDDMYDEPRSQGKADDQREIGLGTAFQQQMRVLRAEETLQDSLQPMRKLEPVDVPAIRHVPGGGGGIAPRPQVRPPRPAEDDWDAN